jgi:hypothetical protein
MNSSGAVVGIVGVLRWSSQLYMLGVRFDMVQQSVEKSRNEFKWCEMSLNCVCVGGGIYRRSGDEI